MTKNNYKLLIILFFCLIAPLSHASDLAKEKRWADQIIDALITGDAEWLQVNDNLVLAIYTPSETKPARGAAIVLHGIGVHPDWPDVIHPLRTRLPESGWATLSVQLPILRNEAEGNEYAPLFDEVPGRIQASVDFLKKEGFSTIVISGHSLGVTMSMYYLAGQPDPTVKAMISTAGGPGWPEFPSMDSLNNFKKVTIPFVDIYGTEDSERIRNAVQARGKIARETGKKDYSQYKIEGANHFFAGKDDELVDTVSNWLENNMPKQQ